MKFFCVCPAEIVRSGMLFVLSFCLSINHAASVYAQLSDTAQSLSAHEMEFNIDPKPLGSAVTAFAATTRYQVLYYGGGIRQDTPTKGIHGVFTPEEALKQLLEGTGVKHRFTGEKTFTLEQVDLPPIAPSVSAESRSQLADPDITPNDLDTRPSKPIKVPEIFVKDVRQRDQDTASYVAEKANTATRTDTPLIQVPQSVEVVTQKVIEDQRAVRVEQALRNVSGVALGDVGQSGIAADVAYYRGFPCGYFKNYLRNEDQNQALTFRDVSNIQRLEVLKGPDPSFTDGANREASSTS